MQDCQEEVTIFPETLLLNIPELLLPAKFNYIHLLVATLFLAEITNLPKAGRLKYFLRNWRKLTKDPLTLEIVQGFTIPLIFQPKQTKPPGPIVMPKEETRLKERTANFWRLNMQDRSKRRLFYSSIGKRLQKYVRFQWNKNVYAFVSSFLKRQEYLQNSCKYQSLFEKTLHKSCNLLRRYTFNGDLK